MQFVLPIHYAKLQENTGKTVLDIMRVVQSVCDGLKLYELTDSLTPVITHYGPAEQKDIAEIRSEIED